MARSVIEIDDIHTAAMEMSKRKGIKDRFYDQLVANKSAMTKEEYQIELGRFERMKRAYTTALKHYNRLKSRRR